MKRTLIILATLTFSLACGTVPSKNNPDGLNKTIVFSDVTPDSGINFKHDAGLTSDKWLPEVLAAGVAVADFNRDGSPDLFFTSSGKYGSELRPSEAKNAMFLNDGKGKFSDVSAKWNVTGVGYGEGVAVGDFDNDGFTDLFLTNVEGNNRLIRNTGQGFEDVTDSSGIKSDGKWATSAGFGDFDGDGDLDIFVVKYVEYSKETHKKTYTNRMQTYSAPFLYPGIADQMWRNDGDGKFTDVSEATGISAEAEKGLALAIGDIDKDGDIDIYVANDTSPNQLWINDGSGKFKNIAKLAGCAYSEVGKEEGSMGVDFSDFDGNGLLDIVVTNFQEETTALYSQTKPMLFREVSDAVGIGQAARNRLSFGIDFFDADNDGDEDLLVANGHIDDTIEKNSESVTFAQQNTFYQNLGDGKFTDISNVSGDALKVSQVSRGMVVADFDGDGDLEFAVTNNNGPVQIADNATSNKGNFVGLWLEGTEANRNAIGARLVAKIGQKTLERQIMGAQSYLSVSDFRVHFGLGDAEKIDSLEIIWPGGAKQALVGIQAGKYYYIKQGKQCRRIKNRNRQVSFKMSEFRVSGSSFRVSSFGFHSSFFVFLVISLPFPMNKFIISFIIAGALLLPACKSGLPEKGTENHSTAVSAFYVGLAALQVGNDQRAAAELEKAAGLASGGACGVEQSRRIAVETERF